MGVALIIGQSNVGKTLLMIRLAESFGVKSIQLESGVRRLHGLQPHESLSVVEATRLLTSSTLNQTRSLQSISLPVTIRKGRKLCRVVDSVGLSDRVHPDARIRKGMADTLRALAEATVILHVVDSERISIQGLKSGFGETDYQVMQYGVVKGGYAMVANKMDLSVSRQAIPELRKEFPRVKIISVSALTGHGIDEVKRFIRANL